MSNFERLTKEELKDKMDFIAYKLLFMSEALTSWDEKKCDFDDDIKVGYNFILTDLAHEIRETTSKLEC